MNFEGRRVIFLDACGLPVLNCISMDTNIFFSVSSFALGLVVAIMLFLLPTKPSWLIISLLCVIFLLLLYPIWKNPWIDNIRWRVYILVIIIIGLIEMGVFIWPRLIIIPNELEFNVSQWDSIHVVELKNNIDTIYSIWIKINGKTEDIDLDQTEIVPEKDFDVFLSYQLGQVDINFTTIMLKALDANNKPCVYLFFYMFKAHETRFIKIKSKRQMGNKPIIISLRTVNYSNKPALLIERENQAGFPFIAPETLNLKRMLIMAKRKKPE